MAALQENIVILSIFLCQTKHFNGGVGSNIYHVSSSAPHTGVRRGQIDLVFDAVI